MELVLFSRRDSAEFHSGLLVEAWDIGLQECVGLGPGFDIEKAEISREPALQRAPQAFYATLGLGRIHLDHLHTQAPYDSSKRSQEVRLTLKLFLDTESVFLLWMYKEEAAAVSVT